MYAICIESSHQRGMGHFFRAIAIIKYLESLDKPYILLINNDRQACYILKQRNIKFHTVNLLDFESNWEKFFIDKYGIKFWLDDRMDTDIRHAENVKKTGIKLLSFDDYGTGSELVDYNIVIVPQLDKPIKGKKVLLGSKYLVLDKEIEKYKRIRSQVKKIIVTLGGSDTYGVTLKVVKLLSKLDKRATIIIGPSFDHAKELEAVINENFTVKGYAPSLAKEFFDYDLAITGGGITAFEANAAGLPCIIIANEIWEIDNAKYLEDMGCSVFAGYHQDINKNIFGKQLDIEKMSKLGMENIDTFAIERIFGEIGHE